MTDISFIKPCASLCGYVRHFYTLTCDDRFSLLTFPIGCPQIIFHRGTPLFIPELSAPQDIFTISGQVNFPAHITTGGNTEMIVAVFYPHTIGMFIDTPPSEFYNREISGYDIGDRSLCELAYKVFDAENSGACIKQIEQWLLSRLNRNIHLARMEQIGRAVDAIMACPSLTVGKLADDTCLSRKQFERVFNSYIGMMPKEYAGIVRFQKSMLMLQSGSHNYADIAYTCGYTDQSHFIREFRRYTGATPSTIAIPYSDLFTNPT